MWEVFFLIAKKIGFQLLLAILGISILFVFLSGCFLREVVKDPFVIRILSLPFSNLSVIFEGTTLKTPGQQMVNPETNIEMDVLSPQFQDRNPFIVGNDSRFSFHEWGDAFANSYRQLVVNAPATYTAIFEVDFFLSAASSPTSARVNFPETGWYASGTELEIHALPLNGYSFDHWELNGQASGNADPLQIFMNQPIRLEAIYTQNQENPTAFTLFSPLDGASEVNIDPALLLWNSSSDPQGGAITYDVFLDENPIPETKVGEEVSATFLQLDSLEASTAYYWFVEAKSNIGLSTQSPVWSFTTVAFPPVTPTVLFPISGQVGVSYLPTLLWECENGEEFDLYFGTDASPALWEAGITEKSFAPDALEPGETYFWKIVARNFLGETEGPIWQFTVSPDMIPPGVPHTPEPTSGSLGNEFTLDLQWDAPLSGTPPFTYDVLFGEAGVGLEEIVSENEATSTQVAGLLPNTMYLWQIVAKNPWGVASGPIWSFTTRAGEAFPTRPSGPFPAHEQTLVPTDTQLQWVPSVNGEISYDLWMGKNPLPETKMATDLTNPQFDPGELEPDTEYFWQVVARNEVGETPGPIWSFTTVSQAILVFPVKVSQGVFQIRANTYFPLEDVVVIEFFSETFGATSMLISPPSLYPSTTDNITTFPFSGSSIFPHFSESNLTLATLTCTGQGTASLESFFNKAISIPVDDTPISLP